MGEKTKIEWCDSTCNLMMGCDGCELFPLHCYAARLCGRYAGMKGWPKEFTQPELFLDRLGEALAWKDLTGTDRPDKPWLNGRPRMIFLNDLGDCFTDSISDLDWLAKAVARMGASPHVFLLLTKRPRRLAEFTQRWETRYSLHFPANVWGGTSITGPEMIFRAAQLANARLSVRFLSCEPLLGPIDLAKDDMTFCHYAGQVVYGECEHGMACRERNPLEYCNWVIAGAETGPGARPFSADWFLAIRDQCALSGVPFFFKGYGLRIPPHRFLGGREWNELPRVGT